MSRIYYFLATGLYSGYSPLAPGTAGSLVLLLIFLLLPPLSIPVLLICAFFLFLIGVWVATKVSREKGEDPSIVVIDEMLGMLVALIGCPRTLLSVLIAFVLFRFFDIVKPFPVRNAEYLPSGWGIMTDDLVAGLYTFFIIQILIEVHIL